MAVHRYPILARQKLHWPVGWLLRWVRTNVSRHLGNDTNLPETQTPLTLTGYRLIVLRMQVTHNRPISGLVVWICKQLTILCQEDFEADFEWMPMPRILIVYISARFRVYV